jgi:hypothetical protein
MSDEVDRWLLTFRTADGCTRSEFRAGPLTTEIVVPLRRCIPLTMPTLESMLSPVKLRKYQLRSVDWDVMTATYEEVPS